MKFLWILLMVPLLAGCVSQEEGKLPEFVEDPNMGQGIAPGEPTGHGVTLSILQREDDNVVHLDATVTNNGNQTRYVHNICIDGWSEQFEYEGDPIQKNEPVAVCEAWGLGPLAVGESLEKTFSWDGKIWNEKEGQYENAPAGRYDWTILFQHYENPEGGGMAYSTAWVTLEIR